MVTKEEVLRFAMVGVNAEIESQLEENDIEYIEELKELNNELSKMYNERKDLEEGF